MRGLRGRHVKHTCGTDPEERKAKKRAQGPRRGERKRKKPQNGSRRWKKRGRRRWRPRSRPTRRLPELIAVIGTKQSSTRDSTVQIRVKLKAEGLQLRTRGLFPKKLKKKARVYTLAALASVRRETSGVGAASPRKKAVQQEAPLDDDDAQASSPKTPEAAQR